MPGGKGNIKPADGTPFSSENQPENRKKPNTISGFLKEEIESDGYMIVEDAEIYDPITKKPTGAKVCVRIKLVTGKAVARRLLAVANKGNVVAIKEVMDRTEGKVPDKSELYGKDGKDLLPNPLDGVSIERQAEIILELRRANANK